MFLKKICWHKTLGVKKRVRKAAQVLLFALAPLCAFVPALAAHSSTFDLRGPQIKLSVTRGDKTLPISRISELQPGDKLWVNAQFPANQSERYLLIVAFLQGPTNPPPESWFNRAETWDKKTRAQGTTITVPPGAEQAILFLAPETGGDYATLRSTVRARPGIFVRATADLEQASLDRTRLDKYLDEVERTSDLDPTALKKRSTLLAQTLRIKLNEDCFNKPVEQQSSCLTQNTDDLVINDAHDQSLVATLTSGPSSDLITALGSSPAAHGGYYSPYVGAVVDAARLLNNLRTAAYQYIPALSLPKHDEMLLKLNTPPSFHDPKSVIVVGLPHIGGVALPSLRNINPKQTFCLQQSPLVLPVEGTPVVFSTSIAHDFVLHLEGPLGGKTSGSVDLPATADAVRGGFVVDTKAVQGTSLGAQMTGTLRGDWGFSAFEGPHFHLVTAHTAQWTIPALEGGAIVAGRDSTLHLESDCAACVEKVTLIDARDKDLNATWKTDSDQVEVNLPLKDERAGVLKLKVAQYGIKNPDVVAVDAYQETVSLESFTIYGGDQDGELTGKNLDLVSCVEWDGICFTPSGDAVSPRDNSLELVAQNPPASSSPQPAGDDSTATATLKDGREVKVPAKVSKPRPKVTLVSKNLQQASTPSPVRISNHDELPQDSRLSLYLKSQVPTTFPLSQKIEIATADRAFSTTLSVSNGNLILQDANSALAIFDPLKAFGPAAFGPLRFRAIDAEGEKSHWQPLGVLVRVPVLTEVRCPDSAEKSCTLYGSNLFLLNSVSADPKFTDAVTVPDGYISDSLSVPRPNGTLLYLKLRDDPTTINTASLPVLPERQ
jgi:hypothetical protein